MIIQSFIFLSSQRSKLKRILCNRFYLKRKKTAFADSLFQRIFRNNYFSKSAPVSWLTRFADNLIFPRLSEPIHLTQIVSPSL